MKEGRRYGIIGIAVCLMAAGVWVVGEITGQATSAGVTVAASEAVTTAPLSHQEGQFIPLGQPLRTAPSPHSSRDFDRYYELRAYDGAPPAIPHPVATEQAANDGCSSCHQYGGWAPEFAAEAPRTPHPELSACRQCHVPQRTQELFRSTTWQRRSPPEIHLAALPTSPPPIPHELQMRENCLGCHGASAVPELRTTHPERPGCLQCHVPQAPAGTWSRGGGAP